MQSQSKTLVFSAFLLSLLATSLHAASTPSGEVEDETGFSYIVGSERGPENWGYLEEEWRACSEGRMQSPIDLARENVEVIPHLGDLRRNYKPSYAYVMNRGHDLRLRWDDGRAGSIEVDGREYFLQQCHWHHPSEHAIDGKRYQLELHMVHSTLDAEVAGNTVVVGLLYEIGEPNAFISEVLRRVTCETHGEEMEAGEEIEVGVIDPREIIRGEHSYYRYMGSLTTPPCTEGVKWIVNKQPSSVTEEQIWSLRHLVDDGAWNNARPIQPLNGRDIQLYKPDSERSIESMTSLRIDAAAS
ncbi:hypothetical protein EUGRSUZ_A01642 [Eucalyptus grandis]|uniref:Uncharacterized protein n=2 Tax=Eucalyptus grandis TaxID=71139 RepID=A0ACC3M2H3_EUCGR|nr:hypothetical protein EUGRSUZ_A01642 [Eucalyptus grandis]